jgi:hypothetical protein
MGAQVDHHDARSRPADNPNSKLLVEIVLHAYTHGSETDSSPLTQPSAYQRRLNCSARRGIAEDSHLSHRECFFAHVGGIAMPGLELVERVSARQEQAQVEAQKNLFIEVMAPRAAAPSSAGEQPNKTPAPAKAENAAKPAEPGRADFRDEIRFHAERNLRILKGLEQDHKDFRRSESYLSRAFDFVYPKEGTSLKQVEEMRKQQEVAMASGDMTKMHQLSMQTWDLVEKDEASVSTKRSINLFGGTAVKTSFTLMKGNVGFLGASTAFGLDQARPSSSVPDQVIDGLLGFAKGGINQYAFEQIGNTNWNVGIKAASMSLTSRALETTLNRPTWLDAQGNFDPKGGALRSLETTFNPRALAVDASALGITQLLHYGSNGTIQAALDRNPIGKTVTLAALYGFHSGGSNEALRQSISHEPWDVPKVLNAGASQAAMSAFSALSSAAQSKVESVKLPLSPTLQSLQNNALLAPAILR